MPTPPTHAIRFMLVDPLKLQSTGSVEQSIVLTLTGLVQGREADLSSLTIRDMTRQINRNLAQIAHTKAGMTALERSATDRSLGGGTMLCYYCSRCGRRFSQDRCRTCGIQFTITSSLESVVGNTPALPPRIVAYAKQRGIRFVHEPPRA